MFFFNIVIFIYVIIISANGIVITLRRMLDDLNSFRIV